MPEKAGGKQGIDNLVIKRKKREKMARFSGKRRGVADCVSGCPDVLTIRIICASWCSETYCGVIYRTYLWGMNLVGLLNLFILIYTRSPLSLLQIAPLNQSPYLRRRLKRDPVFHLLFYVFLIINQEKVQCLCKACVLNLDRTACRRFYCQALPVAMQWLLCAL